MNTDKLHYLYEVKRLKSVSKAAEKLKISQSAVSQTISEFENLVGYSLFERTRLGMIPTKKGEILLIKAKGIIDKVDEFENELYTKKISYEIRIATYPGFMPHFIRVIGGFKKSNEEAHILIRENKHTRILQELKEHQIDAGFTIWPAEGYTEKHQEFLFEPVTEGVFALLVNKNSRLSVKKDIPYKELFSIPIFLFEDEYVLEFVNEFEKKYGKLNLLFVSNQVDAARNALLENYGAIIGPNFTFLLDPNVKNGNFKSLKVAEFQNEKVNLGWVSLNNSKLHERTKDFISEFNKEGKWLKENRY